VSSYEKQTCKTACKHKAVIKRFLFYSQTFYRMVKKGS